MDSITRQLQASFLQPDLDFYVVYISASSIGYCSRPVPEGYDYMDPRLKVWNQQVVAARGDIVDVGSYQDRALDTASFSAARSILDGAGELVGFLMINADERQLYQMYADVIRDGSNIYVVNSSGQVISSSRSDLIGFNYFNMQNLEQLFDGQDYMLTRAEGEDVLFTRYYDADSGFTVLEEAPLDEVLQPLRRTRQVVILLALLTLVAGALLARHFSRRIAAPIQKLRDDMHEVEAGDLKQTFAIRSYTELNELSGGMADMLQCIRGLITSIHENEREKRRIELNWLQAQINPHFIYNTLFSIKCMVDMHRNEDAAPCSRCSSRTCGGCSPTGGRMVTVAEQMESLKQYLTLQRYRYDNGFDTLIEYDDQAGPLPAAKLLVQPLVENALQHGIDPQGRDGMVTVIARRQGDAVCIEVEDNGAGMNARTGAPGDGNARRGRPPPPGHPQRERPHPPALRAGLGPADRERARAGHPHHAAHPRPGGRRGRHKGGTLMLKVLVVDDDSPIRRWLEYCVGQLEGFVLAGAAASGAQGLELYRKELPDIVITDIEMPGMSGLEMAARIQAIRPAHIIILTSHDNFSYARQALHSGTAEYILKTEVSLETMRDLLRPRGPDHPARGRRRRPPGAGSPGPGAGAPSGHGGGPGPPDRAGAAAAGHHAGGRPPGRRRPVEPRRRGAGRGAAADRRKPDHEKPALCAGGV